MLKKILAACGCIFLFLTVAYLPGAGAAYYDMKGKEVDKAEYEKLINQRKTTIDKINKEGYGNPSSRLEDPVLLRHKRIEQWKAFEKKLKR